MPVPDQTRLPQEYFDLLDKLTGRVEQLSRALIAPYELTDPLTIGGPTGTYALANPYQTPCEYCLLSFASFGNASAIISTQRNLPQLAATASLSASGGMADSGSQSIVVMTTGQTTIPMADQWFPLADSEVLTMVVTVAGGNGAYITVQVRRRKTPAGVVVF